MADDVGRYCSKVEVMKRRWSKMRMNWDIEKEGDRVEYIFFCKKKTR